MSFQEGKKSEHKDRLKKWPIEDVRDLYQKLVQGRSGLLTPPTAEEEAAGELLDEERRRNELRHLTDSGLQSILALEEEEALDFRLAAEIIQERYPRPTSKEIWEEA